MATLISEASNALEQLKYEIASEFGVQLGPDTTSRENGSVGGEMTKRLVILAEQLLMGQTSRQVVARPPMASWLTGGSQDVM